MYVRYTGSFSMGLGTERKQKRPKSSVVGAEHALLEVCMYVCMYVRMYVCPLYSLLEVCTCGSENKSERE